MHCHPCPRPWLTLSAAQCFRGLSGTLRSVLSLILATVRSWVDVVSGWAVAAECWWGQCLEIGVGKRALLARVVVAG